MKLRDKTTARCSYGFLEQAYILLPSLPYYLVVT